MEARQILTELGARGAAVNSIVNKGYVEELVRKWKGLLEGIPAKTRQQRHAMGVTAMLFENEARHLRSLSEETRSLNVGSFTKFIFPLLRRVVPNLITNDIVSVQPMPAPIGAVFYLDYLYATSKGQTTAGTVFPSSSFDKNYSSEYVEGEMLATGDGANYGGGGAAFSPQLSFRPVRPLDATRGFSVIIREIVVATGAVLQTATDNGVGGFTFSPAGGGSQGTINYANGQIGNFKFANASTLNTQIRAYYYFDGEMNSQTPQVTLDVRSMPVVAEPRRLKALWSAEAAEDLKAFHGADAETELVMAVAQEMALEVDRYVIDQLYLNSTGTAGSFDRVPPPGIPEHEHLRAMFTVLSTVSHTIAKKTLRAPANFAVTSPEITALLEQFTTHGDYRPIFVSGDPTTTGMDLPRPITQHGQFGIQKLGVLNNKLMVYEDPFFQRDMILMGLKGSSFLDAGACFAPYVPLQVTPTFLDPNDWGFRKGMRMRFAFKLVRPDYYGQVRILNL